MNRSLKPFLIISFLLVAVIFLTIYGMSMAKGVLAPIFLAIILAMVLSPVSNFLEKHGFNRGWASFFSDILFILLMLGILVAVGFEIQRIMQNASEIQNRLNSLFSSIASFIESNMGFTLENPFSGGSSSTLGDGGQIADSAQQAGAAVASGGNESGSASSFGNLKSYLSTALTWTFNSLTTFLIIVVYIFFMLLHRDKFEKGIFHFIPEDKREKGKKVISEILEDAQQYWFGHVILITVLTIFYTIGFSIAGMQGAFTTALLASVLTLVPYVGTTIGNVLALGIAFLTTGNMSAVWIVLATVSLGQFFESYFLEPYVVGERMNVNPLFTILSVTIGAAIWGIIGMIVFLPLFSFIKAIADHVPLLQPVGYFIGKEDTGDDEGTGEKIKKKVKEKF